MKNGRKVILTLAAIALTACGTADTGEGESQTLSLSGEIIATLATGLIEVVLKPNEPITAKTLGSVVPPVNGVPVPVIAITGSERQEITFKKIKCGPLGFEFFNQPYQLSYEIKGKYQGRGHYLTNIQFTPVSGGFVAPTWSAKVNITREEPVNRGTAQVVKVEQRLSLQWMAGFTPFMSADPVVDMFVIRSETADYEIERKDWTCDGGFS